MNYYVSVIQNGESIVHRKAFSDYAVAIDQFNEYYSSKSGRCVLPFTSEVINGKFARSFASLTKSQDALKRHGQQSTEYHLAVKRENAFTYHSSYMFLIESDFGLTEADRLAREFLDEE